MLKDSQIISISPEVMGGTPVFAGTRVPVQTFLDYLKAGESINDFLDGFPTVTKAQVISFLEEAGKQLVGCVSDSVTHHYSQSAHAQNRLYSSLLCYAVHCQSP